MLDMMPQMVEGQPMPIPQSLQDNPEAVGLDLMMLQLKMAMQEDRIAELERLCRSLISRL